MSRLASSLSERDRKLIDTVSEGAVYDTGWRVQSWASLPDAAKRQFLGPRDGPEDALESDPFERLLQKAGKRPRPREAQKPAKVGPDPDDFVAFKINTVSGVPIIVADTICPLKAPSEQYSAEAKFDAALIRDILSGALIDDSKADKPPLRFPAGFQISGAFFEGPLDLDNLEGEPLVGLPIMVFRSCAFDAAGLSARNAHLSALTFARCVISLFNARMCRVSGSLQVLDTSFDFVDFEGAVIESGVDFRGSVVGFKADFQHAHILGNFEGSRLKPKTTSEGADVVLFETRIDGAVAFNATGRANAQSPKLSILAEGAQVSGGFDAIRARLSTLDLRAARIGGELQIGALKAETLILTHAHIGRGLLAAQVEIGIASEDRSAEDAAPIAARLDAAVILADTFFVGAKFHGAFSASGMQIEGILSIEKTTFKSTCGLSSIRLRGALYGYESEFKGSTSLLDANIEGQVAFYASTFGEVAVSAQGDESESQVATVTMDALKTSGSVTFNQCTLHGTTAGALSANHLQITGGDFLFYAGAVSKSLTFNHARISGNLSFSGGGAAGASLVIKGMLNLNHAQISGATKFAGVKLEVEAERTGVALYALGASFLGGIEAATEAVEAPDTADQDVSRDVAGRTLLPAADKKSKEAVDEGAQPRPDEAKSSPPRDAPPKGVRIVLQEGLRTSGGGVTFRSCTIGVQCRFKGIALGAINTVAKDPSWEGIAFWMRDCIVQGPMLLSSEFSVAANTPEEISILNEIKTIRGLVGIRNTEIHGNLELYGTTFEAVECKAASEEYTNQNVAIELVGVHITHDLHLDDPPPPVQSATTSHATIEGAALIRRCKIDGNVLLGKALWRSRYLRGGGCKASQRPVALSFLGTAIGGDIRVRSEKGIDRVGIVDLTGCSLRAFVDDGGAGWGEAPEAMWDKKKRTWSLTKGVALILHGCEYRRFGEDRSDARKAENERIEWLKRQWPKNISKEFWQPSFLKDAARNEHAWQVFNPEPYSIAAQVLHDSGRFSEAYQVKIHAVTSERQAGVYFKQTASSALREFSWLREAGIVRVALLPFAFIVMRSYQYLGFQISRLHGLGFSYGFSTGSSVLTVLLLLLVGTLFSGLAMAPTGDASKPQYVLVERYEDSDYDRPAMKLAETPTTENRGGSIPIVTPTSGAAATKPADRSSVEAKAQQPAALVEKPCLADHGLAYAVDAMLVGVDLGPERRCTLSKAPPKSEWSPITWLEHAGIAHEKDRRKNLNLLKLVYSIISTLALVLATLTFTRVLRRER